MHVLDVSFQLLHRKSHKLRFHFSLQEEITGLTRCVSGLMSREEVNASFSIELKETMQIKMS